MGKDNGKIPPPSDAEGSDETKGDLDDTLRRLGEEILREPVPEHLVKTLRRDRRSKPSSKNSDGKPKKSSD